MPSPLRTIYRCPYCRRGRGVIALDVDSILNLATTTPKPKPGEDLLAPDGVLDIDVGDGNCGQRFFVFDPDMPDGRVCAHVVSLLIDVDVKRCTRRGETVAALCASWDHPWFAEHDPDQEVEQYLWLEAEDDANGMFAPTAPWASNPLRQFVQTRSSKFDVLVSGTAIVTMDAAAFLSELFDQYHRRQAFHEGQL